MYRYICIDFGYLSVIVPSMGLMFSRLTAKLAWTLCNHSPSQRATACFSLLSPSSFPVVSSSFQHLISCTCSPVKSFHKPPCRSEAFSRAPLQGDNMVSGPECFDSQTHTEGQGLISLSQPHCCTLDLLSTARRFNGSKLFSELEPFRYLFNGNVMYRGLMPRSNFFAQYIFIIYSIYKYIYRLQ